MPRQRPKTQRPGRADSGPHHALAWDPPGGLAAAIAARRNSVLPSASVLSTNSSTAPRTGRRRILPGRKRQVGVGRFRLGELLDLPPLAQGEPRRPATFVLRVQRAEPVGVEVADHVADPVLAGEAMKATFAIAATSTPCADGSTICARRQVTTDRCPGGRSAAAAALRHHRSHAPAGVRPPATGPVWVISTRKNRPPPARSPGARILDRLPPWEQAGKALSRGPRGQPAEGEPCLPYHPARDRETARPPARRAAPGLAGQRGSTIPAQAATRKTRS
jgi:hypothetical protein